MEGYLSKKGKWMGSRVKRYMKLDGTILSNHHNPETPATWQVSIKDASFTGSLKRKKLVIELYNAKMELYCDKKAEFDKWMEAFANARKALECKDNGKESLNISANSKAFHGDLNIVVKEKSRPPGTLSMSFKVVKPVVREISSNELESDDDEDYNSDAKLNDDRKDHHPRNGPRIYEETPNSMIFKQFAFQPHQK